MTKDEALRLAERDKMPPLPKSAAIAVLNQNGMPLPEPAYTTDQMRAYGRACAETAKKEAADRIEQLELELAICREAIEVAYEVVYNNWPKELDDDSDMAVRRCTLRRLQEAVGKAAPRLLGEAPEGQRMYGLHYRDLVEQRKADEALMLMALAKTRKAKLLHGIGYGSSAMEAISELEVALRERLGDGHE